MKKLHLLSISTIALLLFIALSTLAVSASPVLADDKIGYGDTDSTDDCVLGIYGMKVTNINRAQDGVWHYSFGGATFAYVRSNFRLAWKIGTYWKVQGCLDEFNVVNEAVVLYQYYPPKWRGWR